MSRRGWVLFWVLALIWGMPYFFISVAVDELEPAFVVFGRTALAALVLLAIAGRAGELRPALREWRWVAIFAIIEMAIPWILLTTAEQHIASGLAALIISSVPIFGALTAFALGDRSALRPARLAGIGLGVAGVALLVGNDLTGDGAPPWSSIAFVIVVCVCYGTAPFIISRKLADVPALGVIAISLSIVAVLYLPFAAASLPTTAPSAGAVASVVVLALVCTAVAFVVFFRLIDEVGAARASVITFVNPFVAVALGAAFLDEQLELAIAVGFVLVLGGCWLATRPSLHAADDLTMAATEPAPATAP
ncbi:MAG: EamA family transporter [Ilumatobacteraceae bacterium]